MFNLWSIRKNILVLVIAPTIIVSIALSTYFVNDRIKTLETAHKEKGKILISSLKFVVEEHSLPKSTHFAQSLTQFRDSDSDILALAIIDFQSDVLMQSGNTLLIQQMKAKQYPKQFTQSSIGNYYHLLMPLSNTQNKLYLSVILNRQHLILEIYHTVFMAGLITLTMILLSIYFSIHLSRSIGKPLHQITEELESINDGKLDIKIHTPNIPELAKISQTINTLASSLKLSQENVQHTVDQATSDLTQTLETIEVQNIELDMARKQALQASQVKSEFLANISHEIRTPMNGVLGFTNLLLNTKIEPVQKDYLLTIRKSANNLLSIIEDILDFSKIEAGKMTLDKLSFSLRDSIEEVITMLSPSAVKKGLDLIPLIYSSVPENQLGDPVRVKQILTNLINNAIKFTEKGTIVIRVLVDNEEDESQIIRTIITDTGIGMTDEQLNKLFKPFSQVNQSINRHHSGTGLGLVICKKLVEQMGGEITVESKSNEGTSIEFTLRSTKLNIPDEQLLLVSNLSGIPVLLFDTHPMALLAMKHLLNDWEMAVHDFQNIEKLMTTYEELSKNEDFNPLILLGDTENISDLDEDIKILRTYQHRGIYLIGAAKEPYEIDSLLALGITEYIEKPLTRKQLRKSFYKIGLLDEQQYSDYNVLKQTTFSGLKILTVDDNPANLKLITILLEEMAIDVFQAYDGLSAVEICKEEHFDLIFMDIRMPGIDGIEASARIKEDSLNKRTPIIALTAHAIAGERDDLLSNGLEDYLTKPVDEEQLVQVISQWTCQVAVKSVIPFIEEIRNIKNQSKDTNPNISPNESQQNQSIDWNTCLDIAGGREQLAKEMLADLIAAIPNFREQLLVNDKNSESDELLSNVHKLHGFTSYTGVPVLKSLAAALENELKTNCSDKQSAKLINSLMTEFTNVESASDAFL